MSRDYRQPPGPFVHDDDDAREFRHPAGSFTLTESEAVGLAISDSTHQHNADSASLLSAYTIIIGSVKHSALASTVTLNQNHKINCNDSLHNHSASNVSLSIPSSVYVYDPLKLLAVDFENRTLAIESEIRTLAINADNRTLSVYPLQEVA